MSRNLSPTLRSLRRLTRAFVNFLQSDVGRPARLMAATLLIMMLVINGMNVVNSYVGRFFMSAIERQDMQGFRTYAVMYAGVFLVSTVLAVFFRYTEERLGLLWREWMTRRIVHLYVERRMHFPVDSENNLPNPDQRIAEDVRSLTVTTLSFILMILNSTITVLSFCGVLWAISPTLFGASIGYAIVGSGLTILFGRPLVRLSYLQADFEADFRSELIRVRDCESDMLQPEQREEARMRLNHRIDHVAQNLRRIFRVNRNLGFFTIGYNYMIQLVPILFVAPIFIGGGVEFGIISQSAMAFATIVGALSLIVTQFQSISSYAAVLTRLSELVDAAEGRKSA